MTRLKQIKLHMIYTNMIQYDSAKISALSSKELGKYEYLTGEAFNKVFLKSDKVIKVIKYNNNLEYNLCITLINIICLNLMKYHQLTVNLIN